MYILLTSMDYTEAILPDSAFFYTAGSQPSASVYLKGWVCISKASGCQFNMANECVWRLFQEFCS